MELRVLEVNKGSKYGKPGSVYESVHVELFRYIP